MRRTPHPMVGSKRGVSEVMGALLLIVVVIVAVGALASFIAVEQANAQSRASYLTNVHNENLQIVNSAFTPNATYTTQWSYANVTIRNTNTASSGLIQVKVFNSSLTYWFPSFNEVLPDGHLLDYTNGTAQEFGGKHATLIFPAKATIEISLNMAQIGFARSSSLSITLLTAAGNFFTTTYNPPTAVFSESIIQVPFLSTNRDEFDLSAAQSVQGNGTIQSYMWEIQVTPDGWKASYGWGSGSGVENFNVVGQTFVYRPEALYPLMLSSLNESGPIRVTLTVVDSYGFTGTAEPTVVPGDPEVAPAGSISLVSNVLTGTCYYLSPGYCTAALTVKLSDVFGNPMDNQVIDFSSISGNMTSLTPPFGLTNSAGEATATVVFGENGMVVEALSESNTALKLLQGETGNLEVRVVPPSPVIDSGQSVTLTAVVTGGSGAYSAYAWYQGSICSGLTIAMTAAFSPAPGTSTTYCVKVTDSLGATSESSAYVTVESALTAVAITPSSPTADIGQSVQLTSAWTGGTSTFTVTWYSGPSAACSSDTTVLATHKSVPSSPDMESVSSVTTTYYCAVITDSAGGTPAQSVTDAAVEVTVNPTLVAPTISVTPTAIDNGQSATLSTSISFSGGTPTFTCQWLEEAPGASSYTAFSTFGCSAGALPSTPTGALSTTGIWHFELQVTDSATTPATATSSPLTLTVNPALTAPVISASPSAISSGSSSMLTTSTPFSGGTGPYTCEWLVEAPGGAFTTFATFSCSAGDFPSTSTGTLVMTGTWHFELQVTDSGNPAVTVTSAAVTVTVS